jgi:hypothetical protein
MLVARRPLWATAGAGHRLLHEPHRHLPRGTGKWSKGYVHSRAIIHSHPDPLLHMWESPFIHSRGAPPPPAVDLYLLVLGTEGIFFLLVLHVVPCIWQYPRFESRLGRGKIPQLGRDYWLGVIEGVRAKAIEERGLQDVQVG